MKIFKILVTLTIILLSCTLEAQTSQSSIGYDVEESTLEYSFVPFVFLKSQTKPETNKVNFFLATSQDKNLGTLLVRWGTLANVKVFWRSCSLFPIKNSEEFNKEFSLKNTPNNYLNLIEKFVNDIEINEDSKDSNVPLLTVIYYEGSHTLLVQDNHQSEVPPCDPSKISTITF
jgi:hypothetical protein